MIGRTWREAYGWKDMDTAPRNGTRVLLFYIPNMVVIGRYLSVKHHHEGEGAIEQTGWFSDDHNAILGRPGHACFPQFWQPLPKRPLLEEEEDGVEIDETGIYGGW